MADIENKGFKSQAHAEQLAKARENIKKRGRSVGSKNDEPNSKRAQTARQALSKIGDAEIFVKLFNSARRHKDYATCTRIAFYLYDQAYGKAPEQDQPAGGTPVRVFVGWDPARHAAGIAIESSGATDIAIKSDG